MLRIYFLEVGQGDSIIIEWNDNGNNQKYGIVDSNLKPGNNNPTISFIKKRNIKHIEFIILSHPHTDHFSGFPSLLHYFTKASITVGVFYHTGHYNHANVKAICGKKLIHLSSVNGDINSVYSPKNTLYNLYKQINQLYSENLIYDVQLLNFGVQDIQLNDLFKIKILAPNYIDEIQEYAAKAFEINEDYRPILENNPDANLLSTVLKITSKDSYILLTSDVCKKTLNRLEIKNFSHTKKKLVLTDVPHHGSSLNHNKNFWTKRVNENKIPAVFSVGDGYNHPGEDVVAFFNDNFEIYITNNVGGYAEYFKKKENSRLYWLDVLDYSYDYTNTNNEFGNIEWSLSDGCKIY